MFWVKYCMYDGSDEIFYALSYFQATVSTNTAHLQYKDMTPQYWG